MGGGFPNRGLSDGALDWMLAQLQTVGLVCDRGRLNPAFAPNPLASAQDDGASFPMNFTPHSARGFPDSAIASASLRSRWNQPTEMIPSIAPKPYKAAGGYADGRPLWP